MQKLNTLQPTSLISADRQTINDNFSTVASNFSGTYFPTSNLVEGMRCWRTDQKKMYQLSKDLVTWVLVDDLSAGYNRVERANLADRATKDGNGNDIAATYSKQAETNKIILQCYPVGSIYMSVVSTNPGILFGGVWQQMSEGRVLIGAGGGYTAGTTGGNASVTPTANNTTLSVGQIPSHTHTVSETPAGAHTHTRGSMNITGSFVQASWGTGYDGGMTKGAFSLGNSVGKCCDRGDSRPACNFDASRSWTGETSSASNHTHNVSVANTGGGGGHTHTINAVDVRQPYLVVYMWKRVS